MLLDQPLIQHELPVVRATPLAGNHVHAIPNDSPPGRLSATSTILEHTVAPADISPLTPKSNFQAQMTESNVASLSKFDLTPTKAVGTSPGEDDGSSTFPPEEEVSNTTIMKSEIRR